MNTFETLTLVGIVIVVCAVCLCAHYLQQIAKRVCSDEKNNSAVGGVRYSMK